MTRNTGYQDLYTVQQYKLNVLRLGTYTSMGRFDSKSDNFSLTFTHNDGGKFTYVARILSAKASQLNVNAYAGQSLGTEYQYNDTGGGTRLGTVGLNHFPEGNLVTNPNGYDGTQVVTVDYRGDVPVWSGLNSTLLGNKANYVMDGASSENNYDRTSEMQIARFDGHYQFDDNFRLDFGLRFSDRDIDNQAFDYLAPFYAAQSSNGTGCLVKWKSTDIVLNASSCSAGDAGGYYTAIHPTPLTSYGNDVIAVNNFGGVEGIPTAYAIDPHAMDDPLAWNEKQWPNEQRVANPGSSYEVGIKQTAGYVQANFEGVAGVPYKANVGLQVINTELDVKRHLVGASGNYGAAAADAGIVETKRGFTDILPSYNVAFDLTDDIKLRAAYAKNMTILDAEQWGGAKTLFYAINSTTGNFEVIGGNENGNPNNDPWRSNNYDLSLEWYNAPGSMFSAGVFYVEIASFLERAGVVSHEQDQTGGGSRDVTINTNVQGKGGVLKGIELNAKQAFTYLPGFWSNFGIDANYTYSPSYSGKKDLSGNDLPFQDNSVHQVNVALWYQNGPLQARIADNYRSKRASAADQLWGTPGLELYQKPTNYVDASVSYDFAPNLTAYVQGSNLTGEKEAYYFQWEDQYAYQNIYEKRITVGVRGKF